MSTPYEVLHAEIVTTLTLSQGRGESVEEQAADVLHELLEAGTEDIDRAAKVLLAVRQAW